MVGAYSFELLRTFRRAAYGGGHLVNQKVGALRVLNQIFVKRRVAGQYRSAALIIDSVSVGRQFLAAVVDLEGGDFDSVIIEHDSFTDFFGQEFYSVGRIV